MTSHRVTPRSLALDEPFDFERRYVCQSCGLCAPWPDDDCFEDNECHPSLFPGEVGGSLL